MNTLKSICSIIIAIAAIFAFSSTAYASLSEKHSEYDKLVEEMCAGDLCVVDGETDFSSDKYAYVLTGKTVITKDTILEGKSIYLKSGSSLIIKNGAVLSLNGRLTVERGAKLYVTNGKLIIADNMSSLTNFGRIIVREKGTLTVGRFYDSNGGSSILLQGNMYFGKQSVSEIVKKIQKYDKNFNLNDYCIRYFKMVKLLKFYYCIGDVKTDFYYRCEGDKIVKKGYSLSRVYSEKTREKLKTFTDKYLADNQIFEEYADDKLYFNLDLRFDYSYSTQKLMFSELYFIYGPSENPEDGFLWYECGEEYMLRWS